MITYITIALTKLDIKELGESEDSQLERDIDNVMHAAQTLMIGNKHVQLKITNLPMREDS